MRAHYVTIAAAALALGTSSAAEPPKTPAQQPAPRDVRPAPVVLASADHVATAPSPEAASGSAKPHRVARVTTCRCGGDPQPEPQDEQQ